MRATFWLSANQTTVCPSRESLNACKDNETTRSSPNAGHREHSKSDQFWWTILSSNWTLLPRAESDASVYTIFVGLRFTGNKGTPFMVARLYFREFDSSVRSIVRETREFQFVTELTTAKVFLVMGLVTFPKQFPREIILERCTSIAEVMGSNPVQAWIFFRPNFHYCLSSVHYCEDHFHVHK